MAQGHGKNVGQLERVEMKEIMTNPLLSNMRKQIEKDNRLAKASFYVPKGALQNKANKMVPVLVRKGVHQGRTEEEMSTGDDGSFENSLLKAKMNQSKPINRPETQIISAKKNLKRNTHVTKDLLDQPMQQMLINEDFNSLVNELVDF